MAAMIDNLNQYCKSHNANSHNVKLILTLLTLSLSAVDHYNMAKKTDIAENFLDAFPFIGGCTYHLSSDLKSEFFKNSEKALENLHNDASGIIKFTYENLLVKKIQNFLSLDLNSDCHELDWTHRSSKENGFKLDKIVRNFSDEIKRDLAVALHIYINEVCMVGFSFTLNKVFQYLRGFMIESSHDAAICGSFMQFKEDVKQKKLFTLISNHNRAVTDVMLVATTAVDSLALPICTD